MNTRVLPLVAAAGLALATASPTAASPSRLNFGTQLNAAECDTTGATLVINVVQRVTGDIDSGVSGNFWAYDEYNRHIQVWQFGPGMFCAVVKYTGSFTTVAGPSPNGGGTVAAGVTGTMEGGYRAVIMGTLKSSADWKMKGNVGSFEYSCNAATGQCGSRPDWTSVYFEKDPGYSFSFTYGWWGWIYHAGDNGTWVNSEPNSGDITGVP